MIPKKVNKSIEEVAKNKNYDSEELKDVVMFYWKEVRNQLSNLEEIAVVADKLGTFELKHWKIDDVLENLEERMRALNVSTFAGYQTRKEYLEQHKKLNILREKVKDELKRKKEIKSSRKSKEGLGE